MLRLAHEIPDTPRRFDRKGPKPDLTVSPHQFQRHLRRRPTQDFLTSPAPWRPMHGPRPSPTTDEFPEPRFHLYPAALRGYSVRLRRDGRAAEGTPLLREYGSKAHRGFESLSLRHICKRPPWGLLHIWRREIESRTLRSTIVQRTIGRRSEAAAPRRGEQTQQAFARQSHRQHIEGPNRGLLHMWRRESEKRTHRSAPHVTIPHRRSG
jgi:hypothetical protein